MFENKKSPFVQKVLGNIELKENEVLMEEMLMESEWSDEDKRSVRRAGISAAVLTTLALYLKWKKKKAAAKTAEQKAIAQKKMDEAKAKIKKEKEKIKAKKKG